MLNRREVLTGTLASLATVASFKANAVEKTNLFFGPEVPFTFPKLIDWARNLSLSPYQPAKVSDPETIARIDYDEYQQIKFRPEWAIWSGGDEGPFPIELFHVGKFFKEPVRIFVVSRAGISREVRYAPDLFTYGKTEFAKSLPADTGFAGFRVMTAPGEPDWLSFLGASYFRSPGETRQYGLSTRGLAIDIALPTPEEFPRFSHFWLEPVQGKPGVIVNALLDSERITGAYRIETTRETGALMKIEAHLFPRSFIERPGIAPLTSMFWYGKHNNHKSIDWRPEIHDSDGLAIWSGNGERIWRPLNNPTGVQTSTFFDKNPKGFGLLQRERRFGQYEDDGVFYDRRPSVWVEPIEEWGEGAIQLVEIPTDDEIHDNIVAYWKPGQPWNAGQEITMRYNLYWRLQEPFLPPLAQATMTRRGAGGIPGRPRPKGTVKYVVDFEGGKLPQYRKRDEIEVVLTAPGGRVERTVAYPVVDTLKWRVTFDYTPDTAAPADLRMYLRKDGEALSETWLFQHLPSLTM